MNNLYYAAAPSVQASKVGSRLVLLNTETGNATILNATGALIWSRLTTPQKAEDLTAFLTSEYPGLGKEQVAADTEAFLKSLLEASLISSTPGAS